MSVPGACRVPDGDGGPEGTSSPADAAGAAGEVRASAQSPTGSEDGLAWCYAPEKRGNH